MPQLATQPLSRKARLYSHPLPSTASSHHPKTLRESQRLSDGRTRNNAPNMPEYAAGSRMRRCGTVCAAVGRPRALPWRWEGPYAKRQAQAFRGGRVAAKHAWWEPRGHGTRPRGLERQQDDSRGVFWRDWKRVVSGDSCCGCRLEDMWDVGVVAEGGVPCLVLHPRPLQAHSCAWYGSLLHLVRLVSTSHSVVQAFDTT